MFFLDPPLFPPCRPPPGSPSFFYAGQNFRSGDPSGRQKQTHFLFYIFNTKTDGFEMSVSKTHHEITHFVHKVMKTQ
jgi:hypothetical protein